jgi:2-polyprenyl-6-hydroxyphenyl methylase/3-demethylubiquinone-9 3-methyltransferase
VQTRVARSVSVRQAAGVTQLPVRPRNDRGQYDDLVDEWWEPRGKFAALHWLAKSRGELIPAPQREGAVLLDLGCGGGLTAPHIPKGYLHIGLDLTESALRAAREHGVVPLRADVTRLPLKVASADVVVAGEIFEHVENLPRLIAEIARVLKPGGKLICDTVSSGARAYVATVLVGERLKGGPPPRIHDRRLFVSADRLRLLCDHVGIDLATRGLRPSARDYVRWLRGDVADVRMKPTGSTAVVYQGVGVKRR